MLQEIYENRIIDQITRAFRKSPIHIHQTHEADAEILNAGENSPFNLAVTMDSLCEEISSGLYSDPFLIGWMLVTVNISDLAAVGAEPLGILTSLNLPKGLSAEYRQQLTAGIAAAAAHAGTYVLGGDLNSAPQLMVSGCALGTIPKGEKIVTRMGCRAGDRIYLTALAGVGNAYALQQFAGQKWEIDYKPAARLAEGRLIRRFATAGMDTSDGVIHTLDQLMRLNRCRIRLQNDWNGILHPLVVFSDPLKGRIYQAFERSFILPDMILAIVLLLSGTLLLKYNIRGVLFSLVASGMLIFLGLLDISFNLQQGIYRMGYGEALLNGLVNLICVAGGGVLLFFVFRMVKMIQ
ncbi:MAG: hypothetical protein Kow0042_06730 [Calditrichia bacterium]